MRQREPSLRRILVISAILTYLFALFPATFQVSAGTVVKGQIVSDIEWTASGSPYWVVGNLTIEEQATLTIQAGVKVKFNGFYSTFVDGTLRINGTFADPVTFSSNSSTPVSGDWRGLEVNSTGRIYVDYCLIEFSSFGFMLNSSTENRVENCTITQVENGILSENSSRNLISASSISRSHVGIALDNSSNNTIRGSSFTQNTDTAVWIGNGSNSVSISGSRISSSGYGVALRESTNLEIEHSLFENNSQGLSAPYESGYILIEESEFHNNSIALFLGNAYVRNSTIANSTFADLFLAGPTDSIVINTSFDTSKVLFDPTNINLSVGWLVSVKVVDSLSQSVPYADLLIKDVYGNETFSDKAGLNGELRDIVVLEYMQRDLNGDRDGEDAGELVMMTPHNVSARKDLASGFAVPDPFVNSNQYILITLHNYTCLPDLEITPSDISFFPESPVTDGTPVSINVSITNQGSSNATNVSVRFFDGQPSPANQTGDDQVLSLVPKEGGSRTAETEWVANSVGLHEICAYVDPDENITESNESNNVACGPLEVVLPSIPDLTLSPSDILFDYAPPLLNGTLVQINATIHNIGGANASNVLIRFTDNPFGQIGEDRTLTSVPMEGSESVGILWNATPAGSHEVCVIADPEDEIMELEEMNNDACVLKEVVEVSTPSPPGDFNAHIDGDGFENVTLSWHLSSDDGSGNNSVTRYDIHRGSTYIPDASAYVLHASVPSGTSSYVDVHAGEGDPSNYFYSICAMSASNISSCSINQTGKFTRHVSRGPQLVSFPLIQSDESTATVLQTVDYDKAWYYDSSSQEWKWFMKHKGYRRGLWSMNHTMGLWMNVTSDSNLTVAGIVPAQTTMHLYEGWNLVSFPSFNTTYTVADLKVETGASRAEGYDSVPPYFLEALGEGDVLLAGEAYWVKVEVSTDWLVDTG